MSIKEKFHFTAPGRFALWRIINFATFGLMGGSLLLSSYFIYNYIYRTLDAANAVIVLNSNIDYGSIDVAAYDTVEQKLHLKQIYTPPPAHL